MKEPRIAYSFTANNTWAFIKLSILCVLEFLILVLVFLWWLLTFWEGGNVSLLVGLALPIILPISTFYLFRKKTTEKITAVMSSSEIEIQWPSKTMVIAFADIDFYSAIRTGQETYDRESVRIRLKNGKKIKLTATSDICDLKPMEQFREKFDELAQNLNLPKKPSWDERILAK
jgi:hypothetical protein